jgi:hypothetical protein
VAKYCDVVLDVVVVVLVDAGVVVVLARRAEGGTPDSGRVADEQSQHLSRFQELVREKHWIFFKSLAPLSSLFVLVKKKKRNNRKVGFGVMPMML